MLIGAFPLVVFAQISEQASIEPPKPVEYYFEHTQNPSLQENLDTLETWQHKFGALFDDKVDGLDRWLSGSQEQIKRRNSRLMLYFPVTLYESGLETTRPKIRASIDLARSKNRWQIMVSSFDETSIDSPDERMPGMDLKEFQQQDDTRVNSETSISLTRALIEELNESLKFRVGLKFQSLTQPNLYARLSHRMHKRFGSNIISETDNNLILESVRGLVLESRQSFNLPDTKGNLYRSQTTGTWLKNEKEYLINQRFTKFDKITSHRYYAYFLDGNWLLDNDIQQLENYAIGFNWREKLYKDWLYAELEPRVTWYEEQDFDKANPSLMFMLEMHFYR